MSDGSRLNAKSHGTTTIDRLEEPGEVLPRRSSDTRVELCTWHPPTELTSDLPEGYELQVACCTLEGGTRYFRFVGEVDSFMRVARAGGLAVMLHEKRISPEDATRYRVMFQLYDWLRSRGLRLERTFTAALDLVLRRRSRDSPLDRDILPEMLGLDSQGNGTSWSVDRLLDEGRVSTTDIGMVNPSQDEVIAHGLMVAAQRNPLRVEAERVSGLVRSALYAYNDGAERVTEETLLDVYIRLRRAWQRHLEKSEATFAAWFRGGHSNLPKTLARLSGYPKLDRNIVKAALCELGWRGHFFVAQCVATQMSWFGKSLESALTENEREILYLQYCPRAEFGGLPLIMLKDRMTLIRPFVGQLLARDQRQEAIGALHRVLAWYEEMAEKRRRGDRLSKRRAKHVSEGGIEAQVNLSLVGAGEEARAAQTGVHESLAPLIESVSQLAACRCPKCGRQMRAQVAVRTTAFYLGEPVAFLGICDTHRSLSHTFTVPWSFVERALMNYDEDS